MPKPKEPTLHHVTRAELDAVIKSPAQSIGLYGSAGIGKTAVAKWLVEQVGGIDSAESYQYFYMIEPQSSISIEQIRELNNYLKLKTPGNAPIRRFIVIKHADSMTIEAQNSLLKTLEEPPADTLIILTFSNAKSLLPTITSRLITINIRQPDHQDMLNLRSGSSADFDRAYNLSGNRPALLHSLLNDNEHPLVNAINASKQLLQASAFERLANVDKLSKDKEESLMLTEALMRMAEVSILAAAKKANSTNIKRWQTVLKAADRANHALLANAQRKLVITNLLLSL